MDGRLEKTMTWGHPDLVFLLRQGKQPLLFDGTFRCVPKGFKQCYICVLFDCATELYLPVFMSLMQSKSELAYYHVIQEWICQSDWKMEASSKHCDFELAAIKSLENQFPDAPLVGCHFHWVKAIIDWLKEHQYDLDQIFLLCGSVEQGHSGLLQFLTVVSHEEIESKAIPFVRSKLPESFRSEEWAAKWDYFWGKYFHDTWIVRFPPRWWNFWEDGKMPSKKNVRFRVNNGLERLNRTINELFPTPHPSIVEFVTTYRQLARNLVGDYKNIKSGHLKPRLHEALELPAIPDDYETFGLAVVKKGKKGKK